MMRNSTMDCRGRQTDQAEISDMRPVAWKPDGTPVGFKVVQRDQAQPRVIGADDAPIVSPLPDTRVSRVQTVITGSPIDEAVAFNKRVYSLALVVGLLVVTLAFIFGASLSFWLAALYFGTAFGLTWLVAFLWDTARSPGGIELVNVLFLWKFLFTEQKYRHRRYDAPVSDRLRLLQTILGVAAVGSTVLFFALILIAVAVENMPK